jgi:predicted Zn-dependent protease
MIRVLLVVCLSLCGVSGCKTNAVTGRSQLLLVSESQAISSSKQAYAQTLAPLEKDGKVNNDAALTRRVERITERLIPQAIRYRPETQNWEWSVKVIDDPKTVNAWCMAGGRMAVYTGLIEQIKPTDDELAQVMGHEITHALANHTAERMSVVLASQLGVAVLASGSKNQGGAQVGALAATLAIQLPNSRTSEAEADRIGIELAARAGYDPRAAVTLWDKMGKVSGGGKSKFDWLSTHPAPARRMETLEGLVPQMLPYYEDKSPRPVYKLKASSNEREVTDLPSSNETPVETKKP